jgi:hypothetical protein
MADDRSGGMTEARMPLRRGDMDTSEGMGSGWHIKGVETMATPTSKKNVPRGLILKKKKRVKLNKNIIVKCKLGNRD